MEKVCVLMSTYNGEKYLSEQIESIINQKNVEIELLVRDDGSTDKTLEILKEYKEKGLLEYYTGKNLKPAHSFMNLLYNAPKADYYAFSDQDDFWKSEKIENAVKKIKETNQDEVVYFSNVEIVDEKLNFISIGKDKVKISLASSFIQSPAIGCTMVINNKMREKIISKNINELEIGLHDSWIYRVALSTNSCVVYDRNAFIKYRQHENNVIGAKKIKSLKDKKNELFKVRRKNKSAVCKNLLLLYEDKMCSKDKDVLLKLIESEKSFKNKIGLIFDKRFVTFNIKANIKFYYDILKNRI